jgi:hypothetical protein
METALQAFFFPELRSPTKKPYSDVSHWSYVCIHNASDAGVADPNLTVVVDRRELLWTGGPLRAIVVNRRLTEFKK